MRSSASSVQGHENIVRARPFVKWAGGKRALIPNILQLVPDKIVRYHEPFVGGGALFYALEKRMEMAFLSDANSHLMLGYKAIKKDVEKVIELLGIHAEKHGKQHFNNMRERMDKNMCEAAARLIYLNKTCFNGLYRVNSRNKFNVPMGSYKSPLICDPENLRRASVALEKAEITWQSFHEIEPIAGDFVYCDPPYDGTYSGYTSLHFNGREQELLAKKANEWRVLGVKVVISNSDTSRIRKLYSKRKWKIFEVSAPRSISCNGKDRKPVMELLITNV